MYIPIYVSYMNILNFQLKGDFPIIAFIHFKHLSDTFCIVLIIKYMKGLTVREHTELSQNVS